jgi:hypothetical protein
MGGMISKYPPAGGFDPSKYFPFHNVGTFTNTSNYSTLLTKSGKGFITHALFYPHSAGADMYIKISIDGTVIFAGTALNQIEFGIITSNRNNLVNVTPNGYIKTPNDSGTYHAINDNNIKPLPITNDATGYPLCIINSPIYYKTSLLIEGKTAGGLNTKYEIIGGHAA